MKSSNILCPHCKKTFEISDAIEHQIQDELLKAKTEQSENLRKEYDDAVENRIKDAVQNAVVEAKQAAEMVLEKEKQKSKLEIEKAKNDIELKAECLKIEASNSKENEKQLREQLKNIMEDLSKANKAREDAEIKARKELLEKEKMFREDAIKAAADDYNTKMREQQETIDKLRKQLTISKQVAEQGSQQLQGEILELDVEKNLRENFVFDIIDEVKKGERGSDIRQTVNDKFHQNCGLILWECKNAKTYQASWLSKLRDEMDSEKAQIGVIVFNSTDNSSQDFEQLADNVWIVKPRYVTMLATFLREVLIKVFIANRNVQGKDIKTEMMYTYLTGGEFSNRIRSIIESYNQMAKQLDFEKKQARKRWATQEKILEKITTSLYGMSGDLQGIAGQEIINLPSIEEIE